MSFRRLRPSLAAVVFAVWPLALCGGQAVPPQKPAPLGQKPGDAKLPPEIAKAAKAFDQALKDQQAGREAQAIAGYREVIRLAPNVYPAHMNLGLLLRAQGKIDEAAQSFKRAAGLDPKSALPPTQLAIIHLARREYGPAKAQAAKAVSLDPKDAQAHHTLGVANAGLKDYAGAEREYREAARLAPRNAQYQVSWATTLGALKKTAEAMSAVDAAIKADPKSFQAYMYKGILYQTAKDFKPAIAAYKRAAEIEPREAAPWYNMGICYQLIAKEAKSPVSDPAAQEALSAYLKAIELAPAYPPAHLNAARLYYALGNYRQAARYFDQASALEPKNARLLADAATAEFYASQMSRDQKERAALRDKAEARYKKGLQTFSDPALFAGLANLYEQSSQVEKAAEVYLDWTVKQPKQAAAWIGLAKVRETQKKPDEALTAYQKALAVEPKSTLARMALAALLEGQNKTDEAVKQYLQVVAQEPKNMDARRKLGQLYLRQNKTAEALAQFQEMKKLAPKETAPYVALASAYEREKKYDEAVREYRAMAAANPKDAVARWYVARTLETQKKYDEAVEEYRAIEKIDPNNTFYVTNIPRLLDLAGKKDESLAEYKRLTVRDPKNVQFRAMYAAALDKQERYAEAVKEYEAVLEQASNANWVWVKIGDAQRAQKKWPEARAAYRKAAGNPADAVDAFNKIESTFAQEGKPNDWFPFLQQWLEEHPSDRTAFAKIEAAAVNANKLSDLFLFVKGIAAKNTKDAAFQLDYASFLNRHGRKDEAMQAYRTAASLRPEDFSTRVSLAAMYEEANRLPDAISMYEEITNTKSILPAQLAGYRVKLATLYEKNGQSQLALVQYRQALQADPNNAVAAAAVKRLGG